MFEIRIWVLGGDHRAVPRHVAVGLARQHRRRRVEAHRVLEAGLEVAEARDPRRGQGGPGVVGLGRLGVVELGDDPGALLGVGGDQRQGAEGVDRQGVAAREEPVRHLARGVGLRPGGSLGEEPDERLRLGVVDVALDAPAKRLVVLRALLRQAVGLLHQLREQLEDAAVVARVVAEDRAQRDAADAEVERVPVEIAVAVGVDLGDQGRALLGDHRREALAEAVRRLAGVEHRLVEAAALLPRPVARDRQRRGLEVLHPAALGVGVGGEGLGRALEHAADVVDAR